MRAGNLTVIGIVFESGQLPVPTVNFNVTRKDQHDSTARPALRIGQRSNGQAQTQQPLHGRQRFLGLR